MARVLVQMEVFLQQDCRAVFELTKFSQKLLDCLTHGLALLQCTMIEGTTNHASVIVVQTVSKIARVLTWCTSIEGKTNSTEKWI